MAWAQHWGVEWIYFVYLLALGSAPNGLYPSAKTMRKSSIYWKIFVQANINQCTIWYQEPRD